MNSQDHANNQEKDSGSFVTGFALGIFAGAAGLYFFGTKKGQKVKKKIVNEWNQAKEEMIKQGKLKLEHQDLSLSKSVQQFFNKIIEPTSSSKKNKKKKKKLIAKKRKSKPPTKFKNIN